MNPVHHHNMSKNFTLHFYLCIILPSNIIISCSCVISIRNQNDIRISCRVLILPERMEAPYKAMCSTRKPFRTPLKLAETRLPLHQDFYFSFSVKMPSDGVCSQSCLRLLTHHLMMSQRVYDLTKSQESQPQSSHLGASILSPDTVAQQRVYDWLKTRVSLIYLTGKSEIRIKSNMNFATPDS